MFYCDGEDLEALFEGGGMICGVERVCGCGGNEIITRRMLCRLFCCSANEIERKIVEEGLPPPDTVNGKRVWFARELGDWLTDSAMRKQAQLEEEEERIRAIMDSRYKCQA